MPAGLLPVSALYPGNRPVVKICLVFHHKDRYIFSIIWLKAAELVASKVDL
jgi:hypothetical protein